jgi:hypothetical protein
MSTPSPLDEGLSAKRLTEALRGSGGLGDGRVVDVTVETSRTTLVSIIQRLRLRYAGGDGPATLIRKWPREDLDASLRAILGNEITFYANVAPVTPAGCLPRCYGVDVADGGQRSLLLEDLDRLARDRQRMAGASDVRAVRAHHGHLRHLPRAVVGRPAPR